MLWVWNSKIKTRWKEATACCLRSAVVILYLSELVSLLGNPDTTGCASTMQRWRSGDTGEAVQPTSMKDTSSLCVASLPFRTDLSGTKHSTSLQTMGEVCMAKEMPTRAVQLHLIIHVATMPSWLKWLRSEFWHFRAADPPNAIVSSFPLSSSDRWLLWHIPDWPGAARVFPQRHASVPGERRHPLSEKLHYKSLFLGVEKCWPGLQEDEAGSEPVLSSWRRYGCLIGMLDQAFICVLRHL